MDDAKNPRPAHERILHWLEVLGKVMALSTLGSLVFATLYWFIGEPPLLLVVWQPEPAITLHPTDKVAERLPLSACGADVERLAVVDVQVANEGTTTIGKPDELWTLSLLFPNARCVRALRRPDKSPAALVVDEVNDADPRRFSLRVGVLEARGSVKARLLVVDDRALRYPEVRIETNLVGLPRRVIPKSPVLYRAGALLMPVFGVISLLILGLTAREHYKEFRAKPKEVVAGWRWKQWAGWSAATVGSLVLALLLGAFMSALISIGLAWVLAWFR